MKSEKVRYWKKQEIGKSKKLEKVENQKKKKSKKVENCNSKKIENQKKFTFLIALQNPVVFKIV